MNLCNKNEIMCKNACSYENYERREILQYVSEKALNCELYENLENSVFFAKIENGIIMMELYSMLQLC